MRMISSAETRAAIASKFNLILCLNTGYASSSISLYATLNLPSISAFTFAAEMSACPARGLAPSRTYFFAAPLACSLSGCVAEHSVIA